MKLYQKPYWFKRKRYGYGWVPVTKQGWLVVLIYAVVVLTAAAAFGTAPQEQSNRELGIFLLIAFVATAELVLVSMAHAPRPKWRWGKSKEDKDAEDF